MVSIPWNNSASEPARLGNFGRQWAVRLAMVAVLVGGLSRSLLSAEDDGLAPLVQVLQEIDDPTVQVDLLAGMREGLQGRKSVKMPAGWEKVYPVLSKSPSDAVREHARALAMTFDDPVAIAEMRQLASATKSPVAERIKAIEALVAKRVSNFAPTLQTLVADRAVRRAALRGLAAYDDATTPKLLLASYATFDADEKQDAVTTLAARRDYALALLDALEARTIPRSDVTSFTARQLLALGDEKLTARVKEVWGDSRETPQDKLAKIEKFKQLLTSQTVADGNLSAGRKVFQRTCQQCHLLYGEGAKIGPDLTGSNRANLEYVLTNVIDPSSAIAKEYKMNVIITTDGRVLTGMILEKSGERITLQTVNERVVLVQDDIDEQQESPLSMMPEGQFDQLSSEQIRDLVAYLASKQQVDATP
ncbi:MAG TPA: c-type cytochrome [Pirellulaceae bacterium]|nr:c-type cytochrome [Pirellulaceae bacterium]